MTMLIKLWYFKKKIWILIIVFYEATTNTSVWNYSGNCNIAQVFLLRRNSASMRDHHFDLEKMWMKEYKVDDALYLLL